LHEGGLSFNADAEPSGLEAKLAMEAVDRSTDRHAPDMKNPVPATEENLAAGARLYSNHCAGCHGVPSNPDSAFADSFYPPVPGFFKDALDMPENQNFYIIQHGIRWSGMPAWNRTLDEMQTWQVVAFLSHMQKLPLAALAVFGPNTAAAAASPEQHECLKKMLMPPHQIPQNAHTKKAAQNRAAFPQAYKGD
jgi:mono/diheme cytochrome c family protein